MGLTRRQRFFNATMGWFILMILVVIVIGGLSLELFYIMCVFGFVVAIELTAPSKLSLGWRQSFRWFVIFGLLGFGLIIVQHALDALPPGWENRVFGMI